jgi:hypothetical protein
MKALNLLSFTLALSLFGGCGRADPHYSAKIFVDIDLDRGFVAQQCSIVRQINTIRDNLEWKYEKGKVITNNIIIGTIVVAVIAGVVILSVQGGGNMNLNIGSSGSAPITGIQLAFSNRDCSVQYHEQKIECGKSSLEFVAPAGESIYLFNIMGDIKYFVGSFKSGSDNSKTKVDLKFITTSITTTQIP